MRKKILVILVAALVILAPLLSPYNDSSGFVYHGWPLKYSKSIDTHGVCIGFIGESPTDGCGVRAFPTNYGHLAEDIALWTLVAVVVVFLLRKKMP